MLRERGWLLRLGTIVYATIVRAASSTKNESGEQDPGMQQTKKGNNWHFDMKAHIVVDADSCLVHTVTTTPANEHDITQAHALVHGAGEVIYRDSGYPGADKREYTQAIRATWHVAMKTSQRRAIKDTGISKTYPMHREAQGCGACQGGAPVPCPEMPVWLPQGSVQKIGQEHSADFYAVCLEQFLDGEKEIDDDWIAASKKDAAPLIGV